MSLPVLTTTLNPFPTGKDKLQHSQVYKGEVVIATGGDYQTSGLPWALAGPGVLGTAAINWCEMYSPSTGFTYKYDPVNATIRIWQPGATTGTIANTVTQPTVTSTSTAPTITTSSGGVTTPLGVAAGALSETAGASGITGVQAPTITSTATAGAVTSAFTGLAAGPLVELANGASVTADTVYFRAECASN